MSDEGQAGGERVSARSGADDEVVLLPGPGGGRLRHAGPPRRPPYRVPAGVLVADRLTRQGVTILDSDITGQTHQDRKLLTGGSPPAANALGLLAADALVEAAAAGD